jgi:hypothetical protein
MKAIRFTKPSRLNIFAGLSLLIPVAISAQAPAGPLPATPSQAAPVSAAKPQAPPSPRTTILGAWKLNRDESDDFGKRSEEDRGSSNGGYGGRRSGGGWPGGGYPGGGRGGSGRPRGESDEERQKMHELLTPPRTMTLSMTGAEVDLLDDRDRKRAFMTDGRKLQKSKDDNYQEIAAKFDANRLVTDEKSPRGRKMSRTFELSSDGMQLYETLRMESGRSNRSMQIRYVYDLPAQTEAQRKQ